jgi:hypothetical protein
VENDLETSGGSGEMGYPMMHGENRGLARARAKKDLLKSRIFLDNIWRCPYFD